MELLGRIRKVFHRPLAETKDLPKRTPKVPSDDHVKVDYRKKLSQMIADGHFDWVNKDVTRACMPLAEAGVVEFESRYFHFDCDTTMEEMLKCIASADMQNPWTPAKIEHLLARLESSRYDAFKFNLVGLGSVVQLEGRLCVPYIFTGYQDGFIENDSALAFSLVNCEGKFTPTNCFLAVRQREASASESVAMNHSSY